MPTAEPEVLASGYQLVEGPRCDGKGGVYFTDALGGGVHRWSTDGIDIVVPKRRGVGGLALHADGGVVVSGRDVTHVAPDGTNRLLFAAPEGVTGFNDIAAMADGTILAGGLRFMPFTAEDPVPGAFWHVTSPETSELVIDNIEWPNGVGDTGDGVWCCNDYSRGRVWVIDGDDHRMLTTPTGEADGLAFDEEGGVWVAQPRAGSLVRLRLDGSVDQTLELPGVQPASVAFDDDTMYVTTIANDSRSGELLRLRAPIAGRRHHFATI